VTDKLLKILQDSVDDPMWADHVEMPKRILRIVIERLRGDAQGRQVPWKGNLSVDLRKGALSVSADGITLIDEAGVCWAIVFPDKTGSYDHASTIVSALAFPSTDRQRCAECDGPDGCYRCPDQQRPAQDFQVLKGEDGWYGLAQLRSALADIDISAYNAAKWRVGKAMAVLTKALAISSTHQRTPERTMVIGRVTGKILEGDQVAGMHGAICHACGLKDYPCVNPDCPNKSSLVSSTEGK
jgi:hypothetical protein